MTPGSATISSFDFQDLDQFSDGHPWHVWRALRQHAPVYWHEKPGRRGFWLITKHADIVTVSRDAATFSSTRGVGLPGPEDEADAPALSPEKTFLDLLDPPDHTRIRRVFGRAFTVAAVKPWEGIVRDLGTMVLDEMLPREHADLVSDFATRVSLSVLSVFMGIPQSDWQRIAAWTEAQTPDFVSLEIAPERAAAAEASLTELRDYLMPIIDDHVHDPRDDLISQLLRLEKEGLLTRDAVTNFCLTLIGVGHETTRDALAGGIIALLQHREQFLRLESDPSLIDTMVEEVLRWTSPVVFFGRFVTRDTALSGEKISAGQRVLTVFPSANFDEDVFKEPDKFDIGRAPNDHLAFGAGNHFCIGASLARMQLRTLIPLVFRRLPNLELVGTPVRLRSNFMPGFSRAQIRF